MADAARMAHDVMGSTVPYSNSFLGSATSTDGDALVDGIRTTDAFRRTTVAAAVGVGYCSFTALRCSVVLFVEEHRCSSIRLGGEFSDVCTIRLVGACKGRGDGLLFEDIMEVADQLGRLEEIILSRG